MTATKIHFLNIDKTAAEGIMARLGQPRFRATQLLEWIFKHRVYHADSMKNLPPELRRQLSEDIDWSLPSIIDRLEADDSSTKLLLQSANGLIEMVVMRYHNRTSVCVSSQVGCKFGCRFCQTGRLGFVRNLFVEEILSQIAIANSILCRDEKPVSHVVFMGMGEPLDNYENVVAAVKRLTAKDGFSLRWDRVTISTLGLPEKIERLAADARCALAVSLHAARDALREELMPFTSKTPLTELKKALLKFQRITDNDITFEFILIKDKNSSLREAKELVTFCHGLRVKVNLIPFNPFPELPFERPSDDEIRSFQSYLSSRSIPAPVRHSKGLDISAACGQLAAKTEQSIGEKPERRRLLHHDP